MDKSSHHGTTDKDEGGMLALVDHRRKRFRNILLMLGIASCCLVQVQYITEVQAFFKAHSTISTMSASTTQQPSSSSSYYSAAPLLMLSKAASFTLGGGAAESKRQLDHPSPGPQSQINWTDFVGLSPLLDEIDSETRGHGNATTTTNATALRNSSPVQCGWYKCFFPSRKDFDTHGYLVAAKHTSYDKMVRANVLAQKLATEFGAQTLYEPPLKTTTKKDDNDNNGDDERTTASKMVLVDRVSQEFVDYLNTHIVRQPVVVGDDMVYKRKDTKDGTTSSDNDEDFYELAVQRVRIPPSQSLYFSNQAGAKLNYTLQHEIPKFRQQLLQASGRHAQNYNARTSGISIANNLARRYHEQYLQIERPRLYRLLVAYPGVALDFQVFIDAQARLWYFDLDCFPAVLQGKWRKNLNVRAHVQSVLNPLDKVMEKVFLTSIDTFDLSTFSDYTSQAVKVAVANSNG